MLEREIGLALHCDSPSPFQNPGAVEAKLVTTAQLRPTEHPLTPGGPSKMSSHVWLAFASCEITTSDLRPVRRRRIGLFDTEAPRAVAFAWTLLRSLRERGIRVSDPNREGRAASWLACEVSGLEFRLWIMLVPADGDFSIIEMIGLLHVPQSGVEFAQDTVDKGWQQLSEVIRKSVVAGFGEQANFEWKAFKDETRTAGT